MRTSVYIRVLLIKRMRRRTDGKTFVNIIIRQCRRFFWIFPHTLLRPHHTSIASGFPISTTNGFVGGTFNVFSLTRFEENVHIFIL